MIISSKGKYAVRVMAQLAADGGSGEYIPLKRIAEQQHISLKYSESIMAKLSKAGFVTAASGKGGGYILAKDPSQYRVSDILKAADESIAPVSCTQGQSPCENIDTCCTFPIWNELSDMINSFLDSKTLADVVANMPQNGSI